MPTCCCGPSIVASRFSRRRRRRPWLCPAAGARRGTAWETLEIVVNPFVVQPPPPPVARGCGSAASGAAATGHRLSLPRSCPAWHGIALLRRLGGGYLIWIFRSALQCNRSRRVVVDHGSPQPHQCRNVIRDPGARWMLSQALDASYMVFGGIEENFGLNVTTDLIDARRGCRTPSASFTCGRLRK